MEFQGTIITIWSPKSGVGVTTILASLLKKVMKYSTPKKTLLITSSIYSRSIIDRTGVKTDLLKSDSISDFHNVLNSLSNDSKKFKKYNTIFIDCGSSASEDVIPSDDFENSSLLSTIIEVSNIIIGIFVPDASHRETQKRFENAIFKNNKEKKHVLLMVNKVKPNYCANTEEHTIKSLDQMCEKYGLVKAPETMGYNKFIELESKALDTKSCKGALFWLADCIKEYSSK